MVKIQVTFEKYLTVCWNTAIRCGMYPSV